MRGAPGRSGRRSPSWLRRSSLGTPVRTRARATPSAAAQNIRIHNAGRCAGVWRHGRPWVSPRSSRPGRSGQITAGHRRGSVRTGTVAARQTVRSRRSRSTAGGSESRTPPRSTTRRLWQRFELATILGVKTWALHGVVEALALNGCDVGEGGSCGKPAGKAFEEQHFHVRTVFRVAAFALLVRHGSINLWQEARLWTHNRI